MKQINKAASLKLQEPIMKESEVDRLEETELPLNAKVKTLLLTLQSKPFQVMLSGEKTVEFRKPSDWIKSRLFNKDGSRKEYDVIKFVNGYGEDKPFFVAIFDGFDNFTRGKYNECANQLIYSNGLEVILEEGDFQIYLGNILKKGNLK